MAEEQNREEWIKVPEDKIEDLDLPEGKAEEVKGGAVDAFLKYSPAGDLYVKVESPYWKWGGGGQLGYKY